MNSMGTRAPKSKLLGWLGWAGLDAVGRLALMTGSTIAFSRMLAPRDFGLTALVLTIVATASIFVGAPFEEALAQRRFLRRAHLRAALGSSWLIGAAIMTASLLAGGFLARYYHEPDIAVFLPVAMTSIFFSGHSDILTALARRLRRFNDVAYATLFGHVFGVVVSLAMALAGYGLWALVTQRLIILAVRAIVLQARIGYLILPSWSTAHVREFGRFAGVSFLSRLTDNVTYLAFNNLVEAFYGVTVLGHVNMAMRLIEPIRGAVLATGHNLAFSFFARAGHDRARLRALADHVVAQAAMATVPVFAGMAAVAPTLLPIVAGPGWDDAIGITICLSIASAIAVPANLVYTAFSADARPEMSLISYLTGFATIVLTLLLLAPIGPASVGLSRIAGDFTRAALAIGFSSRYLGWSKRERFEALAPAWMLGAIMGCGVALIGAIVPHRSPGATLAFLVCCGVAIYVALIGLFARPFLGSLASHFDLTALRRRRAAQ